MSTQMKILDPTLRSRESLQFETALRSKIVGQDEAVRALVELHQVFRTGLNSPGQPVGNLLFLGPTGSGKTRIVEAAAEILFEDPKAVRWTARNSSIRMRLPSSSDRRRDTWDTGRRVR